MQDKLMPIPTLPPEIIEAVNADELCIFIGAGISRMEKCKGWDSLARSLTDKCFNLQDGANTLINYKEKERLGLITDHRKVITICHNILCNSNKEDMFYHEMENALLFNQKTQPSIIYNRLSQIKALFVTTNADELLDMYFREDRIFCKLNEYDYDNLENGTLYHIHGRIKYRDSLVFTLKDYIRAYDKSSRLFTLLQTIFIHKSVLFLGYGLNEFELLEFLFQNESLKKTTRSHFLLKGFYSGEEKLIEMETEYHKELGIRIIPYLMDTKGYEQQRDIIFNWTDEIRSKSLAIPESMREIDEAIR